VIDHQLAKSGLRQGLDMMDDQRLAARLQQRFRRLVGQRAHTLATAGSQDHCFHGNKVQGSRLRVQDKGAE